MAIEVHSKLIEIAERETEKKRRGLISALSSANSPSPPTSMAPIGPVPRDPVTSNNVKKDTTADIIVEQEVEEEGAAHRRKTSTLTPSERQKRSIIRNYKAIVDSWEEEQNELSKTYYEVQIYPHSTGWAKKKFARIFHLSSPVTPM